jgi:hypothetical protein
MEEDRKDSLSQSKLQHAVKVADQGIKLLLYLKSTSDIDSDEPGQQQFKLASNLGSITMPSSAFVAFVLVVQKF